MCTAAITITAKALTDIDNAEVLLKIKGFIAMFIQTMEVSIYPYKTKIKRRKKIRKIAILIWQSLIVSRVGDTPSLLLIISSYSSSINMPSC